MTREELTDKAHLVGLRTDGDTTAIVDATLDAVEQAMRLAFPPVLNSGMAEAWNLVGEVLRKLREAQP